MLDFLRNTDHLIFHWINSGGSEFWDPLMIALSKKWLFTPIYLWALWLVYKRYKRRVFTIILCVIALIAAADSVSSKIIKPWVQRYRPNKVMEVRHPDPKDGSGMYGFVSSHAANTAAIFLYFGLLLAKGYRRLLWALPVPILVCWSRVYLGVHYPADVLVGASLGAFFAWLMYFLTLKYLLKGPDIAIKN